LVITGNANGGRGKEDESEIIPKCPDILNASLFTYLNVLFGNT
jgi:hypothetical protein